MYDVDNKSQTLDDDDDDDLLGSLETTLGHGDHTISRHS